ncbi:MAG: TatD family hydrolase, partial [Bdellovibrionales bacterium]|nr:TatD family hydrolase [Bdellovibrionales bacterium]
DKYSVTGFVHSFSGSYEVGKRYFDQGILLSFGPGVLSKNFIKARECLKKLPLEALLIESDAPYTRDDQSDPVKTFFSVAEEVAKIKEIKVDLLFEKVEENFKRLMDPS